MGFIQSGSTLTLTAYLTQKGRESLLVNKDDFKVIYFALGDSDNNYNIENTLVNGSVPDITGDNVSCIKSIANNIDIKNKIIKI